MSARANPRLVGVFVLVAAALLVVVIATLTGGDWFAAKDRYAVYFPGSVKGLNPGAPVTFRGVKVGEVVDIVPYATQNPDNPVVIEVVLETKRGIAAALPGQWKGPRPSTARELAESDLGKKLRARMLSQSLLTGKRYIDVDFLPNTPARRMGLDLGYPELATTPTALEKMSGRAEVILNKLADLPIERMLDDLSVTLASMRKILESPDLQGALSGIHRSSKDLQPVLAEARVALRDLHDVLETTRDRVNTAGGDVHKTMAQAQEVLDHADKAMRSLDSTINNTDQAQATVVRSLMELQQTLEMMRSLVEYLQTHPEAVVLGKQKQETK